MTGKQDIQRYRAPQIGQFDYNIAQLWGSSRIAKRKQRTHTTSIVELGRQAHNIGEIWEIYRYCKESFLISYRYYCPIFLYLYMSHIRPPSIFPIGISIASSLYAHLSFFPIYLPIWFYSSMAMEKKTRKDSKIGQMGRYYMTYSGGRWLVRGIPVSGRVDRGYSRADMDYQRIEQNVRSRQTYAPGEIGQIG